MKKYFLENKIRLLISGLVSLGMFICVTILSNMYGRIYAIIESKDFDSVTFIFRKIVFVIIMYILFQIILNILLRTICMNMTCSLRSDIFKKIYTIDYQRFNSNEGSYYISMLTNDVQLIEELYFEKIFCFMKYVIQLVVIMYAVIKIGWRYCLVIGLFSIPIILQPYILKKRISKVGEMFSNKLEGYMSRTDEFISGFSTIKGLGNGKIISSIFGKETRELQNANYTLCQTNLYNGLMLLFVTNMLRVGMQIYSTNMVVKGILDVASLATMLGLINNLNEPLTNIIRMLETINSTIDVRKKIDNFLKSDNSSDGRKYRFFCGINLDKKIIKNNFIEEIYVKNVSFSYNNEKNVLDQCNLKLQKGKKYAFVGESGSGKSTLLKLIMGYYYNYDGEILVNDIEIKKIERNSIKNNITYVNQNEYIFDDTIKNNITLLDNQYSDSQINFILNELKLDTLNDKTYRDKGVVDSCSGGEKQRIALARALIRNNNWIFLDESMSAVDNIISMEIHKKLLLDQEKTIIEVIHRMNDCIKLYDCIYYFENGKILEFGTYEELIGKKGKFYDLILREGA